jgi:6-phosphogluconolactonase
MKNIVCPDLPTLVEELEGALIDAIEMTGHKPFSIALSGGTTPKVLYQSLAMTPLIEWPKVELFFGDERPVPYDHPESNFGMVKKALLDELGPAKVIAHPMPAEAGDTAAYEQLIRSRVKQERDGVPVLDLVLLGVGADGHTASLFPGSANLAETKKLVAMNESPRRMTITLPLINAAKRVWIIAAGPEKKAILERVQGKSGDLPIQKVRPDEGELVWWVST